MDLTFYFLHFYNLNFITLNIFYIELFISLWIKFYLFVTMYYV
jgi:hypothetical protein